MAPTSILLYGSILLFSLLSLVTTVYLIIRFKALKARSSREATVLEMNIYPKPKKGLSGIPASYSAFQNSK